MIMSLHIAIKEPTADIKYSAPLIYRGHLNIVHLRCARYLICRLPITERFHVLRGGRDQTFCVQLNLAVVEHAQRNLFAVISELDRACASPSAWDFVGHGRDAQAIRVHKFHAHLARAFAVPGTRGYTRRNSCDSLLPGSSGGFGLAFGSEPDVRARNALCRPPPYVPASWYCQRSACHSPLSGPGAGRIAACRVLGFRAVVGLGAHR